MGKAVRKDKGILRKLNVEIDGIPAVILGVTKPQGHFIYVHINVVTKEVFYVGQGVNSRFKGGSRGKWWRDTARKYGVEIDVIVDNLSKEEANQLEVCLIKYFGRKDLGSGTLVNHTDGGDGGVGVIVKEDTRKRLSERNTGIGNGNADVTQYTFVNINTNQEMVCTRVEFKKTIGVTCATLFMENPNKTKRGWYLKGELTPFEIENLLKQGNGLSNPKADKNVYTFIHTVTNESFTGTRIDFQQKYNQNVYHLFTSNSSKTVKKWKVLKQ